MIYFKLINVNQSRTNEILKGIFFDQVKLSMETRVANIMSLAARLLIVQFSPLFSLNLTVFLKIRSNFSVVIGTLQFVRILIDVNVCLPILCKIYRFESDNFSRYILVLVCDSLHDD